MTDKINNLNNNQQQQFKSQNLTSQKKEIDYEYSLLEEFYAELKEKLRFLISEYNIEETTSYFLIKMFRLDALESNHFDLISFIERIKDFSDVKNFQFTTHLYFLF